MKGEIKLGKILGLSDGLSAFVRIFLVWGRSLITERKK